MKKGTFNIFINLITFAMAIAFSCSMSWQFDNRSHIPNGGFFMPPRWCLVVFHLLSGIFLFSVVNAATETQITILPGTVVFVDSTTMISYAGEVIFSGEELIVRGSIKTREEKPAMITEVSAGKPATHSHDTKPKRTKTAINTHTQVYRLPLSSQPSPDSPGYQYFSAVSPANTSKEKTPKEFLVTSNDYAPFLSFSSTIFPSRIPHHASRITRHAQNKSPPTTNGEMVKW